MNGVFVVLSAMATVLALAGAWVGVSFRRCECSERVAELENASPAKSVGFGK